MTALPELLDLAFRWVHVIAGIMWIGNSLLFNWLDRNLRPPTRGPGGDAQVDARARTLARANPEAMAQLKRVFWAGTEHWETLLAERAMLSGRLVLSDFTRQAVAAFRAR